MQEKPVREKKAKKEISKMIKALKWVLLLFVILIF